MPPGLSQGPDRLPLKCRKRLRPLCEDCLGAGSRKIPARVLDCKIDGPKLMDAPTIDGSWCDDCRAHFKTVTTLLEKAGGRFVFTPRLVRGLDYYSRTVFEVTTTTVLGAQDALRRRGGRYDKLVKQLGGPDVPGIGFALGSERTLLAIRCGEEESRPPVAPSEWLSGVCRGSGGRDMSRRRFNCCRNLRVTTCASREKDPCSKEDFFRKKLGAQLALADRLGAAYCIILGSDELAANEVTFRSLKDSAQVRVSRAALVSHLLTLRPNA